MPSAPIDLAATIAGAEADLEMMIQQKGGEIVKDNLPPVAGAPVLIEQLFYNLINNALKFGKADINPRIVITGESLADNMVKITVADNGIGFESEYAEDIFKSFARLHSKGQYDGTGLRLSLCRRIVARHGGTIKAEGHLGEGAIFTFTLPAATTDL